MEVEPSPKFQLHAVTDPDKITDWSVNCVGTPAQLFEKENADVG